MNWAIYKNYYLILLLFLVTNLNIILLFFLVKSFLVNESHIVEEPVCGEVLVNEWGPALRLDQDLLKPVKLVVVTHTTTRECNTDAECINVVSSIRNSHISRGLADIGFSFLVGGNGKIYEGAGWKVGSHTIGFSNNSISLSFIGDFRSTRPKPEALAAAQNFLGCILNVRYLGCEYRLVGQRQLIPTINPGDALQTIIQTWPHWTDDDYLL